MVKAEDAEDFARRGMEDLRSRNPMFRMPNWFSEDDDMSDLATRMSHTPHFATLGRRGGAPWPRERRSSGGSAMSATSEDDSYDAGNTDKSSQCSGGSMGGGQGEPMAHEIPIKIELGAPASSFTSTLPPDEEMIQADPHVAIPLPATDTVDAASTMPPPVTPVHTHTVPRRVSGQHPVRNASALDNTSREEFPRSTRCSSAPPDMVEQKKILKHQNSFPQNPQRFVSKINITPGVPGSPPQSASSLGTPPAFSNQGTPTCMSPTSPTLPQKFNTIPKPFVSMSKPQSPLQTIPDQYEQQEMPQQQYVDEQRPYSATPFQQPQQQHYQQPQQHIPQQPQQQSQGTPRGPSGQRPSIVRNIPIFIEGMDDPIKPREPTPPKPQTPQQQPQRPQRQSQQQQQPQQQQQWQQQQPQLRPQQSHQSFFAQQPQPQQQQQQQPFQQPFVNVRQARPQQQQPQAPQQQQQQNVPIQTKRLPTQQSQPQFTQHTRPQQQQQQQQPQQQTQAPSPQPKAPSPQPKASTPQPEQAKVDPRFAQIQKVEDEVCEFEEKVKTEFAGDKKSKEYLYLDEMLTRCLLKLDNVDPQGCEDVRAARKAVIRHINAAISLLEAKASGETTASVPESNSTNLQPVEENGIPEAMETEIQNLEIPSNPTVSSILSPSPSSATLEKSILQMETPAST